MKLLEDGKLACSLSPPSMTDHVTGQGRKSNDRINWCKVNDCLVWFDFSVSPQKSMQIAYDMQLQPKGVTVQVMIVAGLLST
jgi:hypothetical protein